MDASWDVVHLHVLGGWESHTNGPSPPPLGLAQLWLCAEVTGVLLADHR